MSKNKRVTVNYELIAMSKLKSNIKRIVLKCLNIEKTSNIDEVHRKSRKKFFGMEVNERTEM